MPIYKHPSAQDKKRSYGQDVEELGHNIRDAREKAGLSLDDLARLINSDKSHLSRVENGTQIPKIDTIFRIMDALDISSNAILPARFMRNSKNSELDCIYALYAKLPEGKRNEMIRYIRALMIGLSAIEQTSLERT